MATAPLILNVLQILLTAEPAVVQAIHNILTGGGTADDLATLKADSIAWQAIADKAAAEIARVRGGTVPSGPPPAQPPTPITQ